MTTDEDEEDEVVPRKIIVELINWDGLQKFNLAEVSPKGKTIFDHVRDGIHHRINLGYSISQISKEITKAGELSVPIKPSSLRTWLARRRMSCRAIRKNSWEAKRGNLKNLPPLPPEEGTEQSGEAKPEPLDLSKWNKRRGGLE